VQSAHFCEELWHRLGHEKTLAYEKWPGYDDKYLIEDQVEMAILIGGKVRAKMTLTTDLNEDEIKRLALEQPKVQEFLTGKQVIKTIVVPRRTVNLVVKNA